MIVLTIENRGRRNFVISKENHISGGVINKDPNNQTLNISIVPGSEVRVTESCGKKLAKEWPNEIRILKTSNVKSTRKE